MRNTPGSPGVLSFLGGAVVGVVGAVPLCQGFYALNGDKPLLSAWKIGIFMPFCVIIMTK